MKSLLAFYFQCSEPFSLIELGLQLSDSLIHKVQVRLKGKKKKKERGELTLLMRNIVYKVFCAKTLNCKKSYFQT